MYLCWCTEKTARIIFQHRRFTYVYFVGYSWYHTTDIIMVNLHSRNTKQTQMMRVTQQQQHSRSSKAAAISSSCDGGGSRTGLSFLFGLVCTSKFQPCVFCKLATTIQVVPHSSKTVVFTRALRDGPLWRPAASLVGSMRCQVL